MVQIINSGDGGDYSIPEQSGPPAIEMDPPKNDGPLGWFTGGFR
jgi:hypothetical protein